MAEEEKIIKVAMVHPETTQTEKIMGMLSALALILYVILPRKRRG